MNDINSTISNNSSVSPNYSSNVTVGNSLFLDNDFGINSIALSYILGPLIVLSNLTVVISSGLVVKRGHKLKSTYILLGNVSMADTLVGVSIMTAPSLKNLATSDVLCLVHHVMVISPITVSIYTVALIAIDRYIYIIHGLYYHRWVSTIRVRIAMLNIWILSVLFTCPPAFGFVNAQTYRKDTACSFTSLYNKTTIIINMIIGFLPICIVVVLYTILIKTAISNIKKIEAKVSSTDSSVSVKPKLRATRGSSSNASFKDHDININANSNNDVEQSIIKEDTPTSLSVSNEPVFSIMTVTNASNEKPEAKKTNVICNFFNNLKLKRCYKVHRCRAIIVIGLSTVSCVIGWTPLLLTTIKYIYLCDSDLNDTAQCFDLKKLLAGPLVTLVFINCLLNPLIYAWWQKRFTDTVKSYFKSFCSKNLNRWK